MNFAIDRTLRQLVSSLSFGELLNSDGSIRTKRGDSTPLVFQVGDRFIGAATLGTPTEIRFGAKVVGDDDGSYVVSNYDSGTGLFVSSFNAGTNTYTITPGWNTAKLNNLLGFDPEGFAETTEVRVVADVAGSLDVRTFILSDQGGTVGVWFDIDAAGGATPGDAAGCTRALKVNTVNTGDPAATVAIKLAAALAADPQFTATTHDFGDLVTVVDSAVGPRAAATPSTSGFEVTRWIAGSLPNTLSNVPSVTLDGEIRWIENGQVSSTATFPVVVSFDVNNGFEGVPRNAIPAYPAPGRIVTTPVAGSPADVTISATTDSVVIDDTGYGLTRRKFILQAGAGAYTAKLALLFSLARPEQHIFVNVEFAASANPTIEVWDISTSTGTKIASATNPNPAAAAYWYAHFAFDGSHWHKLFSAFQ